MALGVSTMERPAGSFASSMMVGDDLQSIATEENIDIIGDHPQAVLELEISEESLPPSRPSSSLLVSSSHLQLPSQSLPSTSSQLQLPSSQSLPSTSSQLQLPPSQSPPTTSSHFSAPASQPSTSSVEEDSAPKRKKQRAQLGEAHQLISAATEALGRIQGGNKNSDEFSCTGQTVIDSLKAMNRDQALEAQRIIHETLYKGRRGTLTLSENSHVI